MLPEGPVLKILSSEMPSHCGWEDVLVQSLLVSLFQVHTPVVVPPGSLLVGTQLKLSSAGQFLRG